MLKQIAEGVWIRESGFLQSNTVVVRGETGVLVVDPGITRGELAALADELLELRQPVVAAFSTHPHWDHVLWHPDLGVAPRYSSASGAESMREVLEMADWKEQIADGLPPEHADEIPMELLGLLTALPDGTDELPWDGPRVRILEHRGHAVGSAALLIEEAGVLVAGDMLSDILVPFLGMGDDEPVGDYLAALRLFGGIAGSVSVVVPGHGSVGRGGEVRERIEQDRAYVETLRDGRITDDFRVGPSAPLYWLKDVHDWQAQRVTALARGKVSPA